jgi:tRNA threonylcarbamoyladenosine modification (KEOPS) complex Cgi121 subunit
MQKEGDILQIYFCAIFRETSYHAQDHVTFGALCALSSVASKTQTATQVGW